MSQPEATEETRARAVAYAAQREANRARMPETAKILDDFRRAFGPGVKLRWARENGIEVGERGLDNSVPISIGPRPLAPKGRG